jgi:uncharacterized membrane protein YesL
MFSRVLKMTFWVAYDHMGKLLLANLFCAIVLAPPLGLAVFAALSPDPAVALGAGVPLLLLCAGVLGPVLCVGLAGMVRELIDTRDGSLATFFAAMRRHGLRAAALGLAYGLAAAALGMSAWFYPAKLGDTVPVVGYALGALAVWALALLLLSSVYLLPVLVHRDTGTAATLKLCVLLVLDNPMFTLGVAAHWAMLATLSLFPPVFFFMAISLGVVLALSAYEMLARKYAAREAHGGERLPVRAIDFGDAGDDYLNRGFRDFLFPWKG